MSTWEAYYEAINSGDFDSACNFIISDPASRVNIPPCNDGSPDVVLFGEFLRVWLSYGRPDSLDHLRADIRAAIMSSYENQYNYFKAQEMSKPMNFTGADARKAEISTTFREVTIRSDFKKMYPIYEALDEGENLLTAAIKYKQVAMAKTLVQRGASVNYNGHKWQTPLHAAAITGSFELVQFLVANGAQVRGVPVLFKAATPEIVVFLIQNGADVHMKRVGGSTALVAAILISNLPVVVTLLQFGADVNAKNFSHRTPLMVACCNDQNKTDIAECLLNFGAAVNLIDAYGNTALDEAIKKNNQPLIQLLRSRGALTGNDLMKANDSSCCVIS